MKQSFEYFALRALMLWDIDESKLHEGIKNNPTPEIIRQSLRHFGVARSFEGIASDATALQFIANALRDITQRGNLTANEAQEKVVLLTKQLKTRFKRSSVSAASKLLWLKHRTPFIIYDSRAIRALQFARKPDYADYCVEWRRKYQDLHAAIADAAGRLSEIGGFVSSWRKSSDDLAILIGEDWFHERIFDVCLWETGGDG